MRSKILFWLLALIVFGSLGFLGFQYRQTDRFLFYITEGVTLLALILFIILYHRLIRPYKIITDGMELLKERDFTTHLRSISDSEANQLIVVFNKMMDSLKEERIQVREKNSFLDLLIHASPQGVIIMDFDERITDINPAGLKLLSIPDKEMIFGKKIKETNLNIKDSLDALKLGESVVIRGSGITVYRCSRSSFLDKGFSRPFILIEELTDELLKIEKKSYEGIIRMMAHEVNNSVGAIGSTLNVISEVLKEHKDDGLSILSPAVDASYERCQHLVKFVHAFAEVVKLPAPHKSEATLDELARSVEALTGIECRKRNIELDLQLTEKECKVFIDAIQFEQVLVNIIKNAYEAIGQNGTIQIITSSTPSCIIIRNNGPGISEEVSKNLFVPFFSTKPSGQGIGLMIVREILRNHETPFRFYSEKGWTQFEILF